MNDEIKEILDYLKIENGHCSSELSYEETHILLDYITNLQEKYNKALEILSDYNMPCEYAEQKMPDEYCEEHCEVGDEIYKKCWNKYIEIILNGGDKE